MSTSDISSLDEWLITLRIDGAQAEVWYNSAVVDGSERFDYIAKRCVLRCAGKMFGLNYILQVERLERVEGVLCRGKLTAHPRRAPSF